MLKTSQWTKSPASGSMTVRASARVPSGAPDQATSGEMPAPSQVNFVGMAAPSAKDGLETANAAGGDDGEGTGDAESEAAVVAGALGVGRGFAGEAVAGTEGVAPGLVEAGPDDPHAAKMRATLASQTTAVPRMA